MPPTITITTTYLQMFARPERAVPPLPEGAEVLHAVRPTVSFYRYLYNTVGQDYLWYVRRLESDEQLAATIHDPLVEIYVLYVQGVPAGYAELDRRKQEENGDIELAYFGLIPEFIGRGLGGYLLRWAIHKAWDYEPGRLFVHTNSIDHPSALPNYQKQGFKIYDTETHLSRDPRAEGIM